MNTSNNLSSAANKTIKCFITSMSKEIYSGEVEGVIATGSSGELGILPGHAPLLTELVPGPIHLRYADGEDIFYIKGGFLEVQPDSIHILADEVLREKAMSEEAAGKARQEAEHQLDTKERLAAQEYAITRAKMMEAVGQLRTLRKIKQKYGK